MKLICGCYLYIIPLPSDVVLGLRTTTFLGLGSNTRIITDIHVLSLLEIHRLLPIGFPSLLAIHNSVRTP